MAKGTKRPKNSCSSCGYTWYPKGHDTSMSCPKCSSGSVSSEWDLGGCFWTLFIGGALFIALLPWSSMATGGFIGWSVGRTTRWSLILALLLGGGGYIGGHYYKVSNTEEEQQHYEYDNGDVDAIRSWEETQREPTPCELWAEANPTLADRLEPGDHCYR